MNLNFAFTAWDYVLLMVVSMMGTALAYLHNPKWKAFVLALPIPFTVACLSLGGKVDATHVLGIPFLMLYVNGVRWLHVKLGLPILPAIILAAGSYAGLGILMVGWVPRTEMAFWGLAVSMWLFAAVMLRVTPHLEEPGHRTPLPVWIKLPVIAGVIVLIIIGKKMLLGLMTMFPMVGLVAAYEGRHSLWTMCRAIYRFALWGIPMMATVHVAQSYVGIGLSPALMLGWAVYLSLMIPASFGVKGRNNR
jgi:hypothetical protein